MKRCFVPGVLAFLAVMFAVAGCGNEDTATEGVNDAVATQTATQTVAVETTSVSTPPVINLPSYPVSANHVWMGGVNSEYDLPLTGIGAGFDLADGTYPGWCLEDNYQDNNDEVSLYSSYDPDMPDDIKYYRDTSIPKGEPGQPVPWDKLNYLLNHKQGSLEDVGAAIFLLMWGTSYHFTVTPAAQAMYDDAEANGAGFVPEPGQIMAIILYQDGLGDDTVPDDRDRHYQDTIIEYVVK